MISRLSRAAVLLAAGALSAYSQSAEFAIHGGVSRLNNNDLGSIDGTNATRYNLGDGWRIGFRTTLNTWRFFGQEFGYAYNRTYLRSPAQGIDQGMAIHQGFYNILAYATKDETRVR